MKKQQILNAATELFFRLGFGAVSMDAVTSAAGVSKATVYAHFASKNMLFSAVLANYLKQAKIVSPTLPAQVAQDLDQLSLVIKDFLQAGFTYFNSPAVVKLYRLLISEISQFPEIYQLVFGDEREQMTCILADYLEQFKDSFASKNEYYRLASQILDLLRGASLWVQLVQNPRKQQLFSDAHENAAEIHSAAMKLIISFFGNPRCALV